MNSYNYRKLKKSRDKHVNKVYFSQYTGITYQLLTSCGLIPEYMYFKKGKKFFLNQLALSFYSLPVLSLPTVQVLRMHTTLQI